MSRPGTLPYASGRGRAGSVDPGRIARVKIAFFGTPEFAVPTLRALLDSSHEVVLVVAQPDRPAGRGMKLKKPPVAELALERGIPLEQPARIRTPEFREVVRASGCELAVVVAYGRILPAPLLEVPPHGFINVHASLLPRYRGAAPIQRAIEAGERVTGVSIMRIDEELDHGAVFATAEIPIGPDERTPELAARLSSVGGALLVSQVDAIESGRATETEQDHAAATFAPMIEKSEGAIDWSQPARKLYDRYRAFYPWPGVFTSIGGEMIKLTEIAPDSLEGSPSRIVAVDGTEVVVGCGEGSLRLRTIQRAGRKPAAAGDVIRGLGLGAGDRLG